MVKLYTPFVTEMTGNALANLQEQKEGEAAKAAYMGDPNALADLYQLNPAMAQSIDKDMRAQEQQKLENTRKAEIHQRQQTEAGRKWAMENRDLMEDLAANVGRFDDYETAKAYADSQFAQLAQIPEMGDVPNQELTPEMFEQFKQLAGGTTDRKPQGSHYLVRDDEGTLYTASITLDDKGNVQRTVIDPKTGDELDQQGKNLTRVHQLDPVLAAQLATSEKRAESEEGRRQGEIEAGLNSIYMMPDLKRAEELLESVETGGLATDIDRIRRYFGDESMEVADMGELQVLLANDLISKFELMTGVLSESDMALLQSISAGTRAPAPVNSRLIKNVIRKAERKINLGSEAARATGSQFDIKEFDAYLNPPKYTRDNPANPTSKAEYDELPSGSYYMKDGTLKRKK